MRVIIKGYKLKGKDMSAVENALQMIQNKVINRSKKFYAQLLAAEIENLVDDIALGVLQRPDKISIYDCAKQEVDRRIAWASANNVATPYNFSVHAAVYTYEDDTYIRLFINNDALLKEIRHLPNADDFNAIDSDTEANGKVLAVWNEISSIYSNGYRPLTRQLFPIGPIEVDWERIEKYFHTREERAEVRVRHRLTSTIYNLLGSNQEVPNYKMMRYLDDVFEMLGTDGVKEEALKMQSSIMASIINISEKDVKKIGFEEVV